MGSSVFRDGVVTLMVLDGWPAIHGSILSVITMAERSHRSTRFPSFPAALAKVAVNDPSPFTVQASSPSSAPKYIFAGKLIRGNFEASSSFVNLRFDQNGRIEI